MPTAGSTRSDTAWLCGTFALALLLRLSHLATLLDTPFLSVLYIDPLMYDEWGRRIASGQLLSDRPFFMDPLYPYVLGAIYALTGGSRVALLVVQAVACAAVAPLTLAAARPWFGRATARVAALWSAVYLPAIFFGGLIMKPGLAHALVALALWCASRALVDGRRGVWFATGVAVGLTALLRGNIVPLIPLLAIWVALRATEDDPGSWRARVRLPGRLREAGVLAAGAAAILALPLAHNVAVGGQWILTTANAGQNFYIGNNAANDTGEYMQLPFVNANPKYEQRDFGREAERRAGRPLDERGISRFWFGESLRFIREDPAAWLRLMAIKVHRFWGAYEIPDSMDYYQVRELAPVLRLPLPGFGLLAPFGLLGACLAIRRRGWPRLLVWSVVWYPASIVFFFVFSRFRMIVVPALFVLAAFAAVTLVERLREARRAPRGVLLPGLALVALAAFVNLPVRAHPGSLALRIAETIGLPTLPETSAQGHKNLGVAYAALAKERGESREILALAEQELRRAVELRSDHPAPFIELGKVLARLGRNEEALAAYRSAMRLDPYDYRSYHAVGLLSRRLGDEATAIESFRGALRIAPRYRRSALRLAETLESVGRPGEAEAAYRYLAEIAPGDERALAGLARLGAAPP